MNFSENLPDRPPMDSNDRYKSYIVLNVRSKIPCPPNSSIHF